MDKMLSMLASAAPLVAIFTVIYFLVIRPQNQRMQRHNDMLKDLKSGVRVVMTGGLMGSVVQVKGDEASLEIASGVHVWVRRSQIAEILSPETPIAKEK